MAQEDIPTFYAPACRASREEIARQHDFLGCNKILKKMLDAFPEIVMILNRQRQAVFINRSLIEALGIDCPQCVIGMRPGEIFNCVHSDETRGGCGTTEFCRHCGAVNAILESWNGVESNKECRIIRKNGDALVLHVKAMPFELEDEEVREYTFFSVRDISHEKRRRSLERIFFHDILNTAGGLRGLSQLAAESGGDESREYVKIVHQLSQSLVDEIISQKSLMAAENNELEVKVETVDSMQIVEELVSFYSGHEAAREKRVIVEGESFGTEMKTDRILLKRTLSNLIKNALEASRPNETVTVGCHLLGDDVVFHVHNPNFMPRDVQLQIFQRSFTTKGEGRGLGTYSVKLLTERYLKGRVSFASSREDGTIFRVSYPIEIL